MPTKKKVRRQAKDDAVDPRSPLAAKPPVLTATVDGVRKVLECLQPPTEPGPSDLVYALKHISFSQGLECGYGQEVARRLETGYVDRNELRITEAFEIAEFLEDLKIDNVFERCMAIRDSIAQIYNDQNRVTLDFLRESTVTERNQFFARVPAVQPVVMRYLAQLIAFEECIFSTRSTQRVQVRLGLDPKSAALQAMFGELRQLLAPWGHLPMHVGPESSSGKPILDPVLCPACLVQRLAAPAKK